MLLDFGNRGRLGNEIKMISFQIVSRNVIHANQPFSLGRSANFSFPVNAIKAPKQMLFDHYQFRSSDRIEMISAKVGIGDVVEFGHALAPQRVQGSYPINRLWKRIYFLLYLRSHCKYNSLLVLVRANRFPFAPVLHAEVVHPPFFPSCLRRQAGQATILNLLRL